MGNAPQDDPPLHGLRVHANLSGHIRDGFHGHGTADGRSPSGLLGPGCGQVRGPRRGLAVRSRCAGGSWRRVLAAKALDGRAMRVNAVARTGERSSRLEESGCGGGRRPPSGRRPMASAEQVTWVGCAQVAEGMSRADALSPRGGRRGGEGGRLAENNRLTWRFNIQVADATDVAGAGPGRPRSRARASPTDDRCAPLHGREGGGADDERPRAALPSLVCASPGEGGEPGGVRMPPSPANAGTGTLMPSGTATVPETILRRQCYTVVWEESGDLMSSHMPLPRPESPRRGVVGWAGLLGTRVQ